MPRRLRRSDPWLGDGRDGFAPARFPDRRHGAPIGLSDRPGLAIKPPGSGQLRCRARVPRDAPRHGAVPAVRPSRLDPKGGRRIVPHAQAVRGPGRLPAVVRPPRRRLASRSPSRGGARVRRFWMRARTFPGAASRRAGRAQLGRSLRLAPSRRRPRSGRPAGMTERRGTSAAVPSTARSPSPQAALPLSSRSAGQRPWPIRGRRRSDALQPWPLDAARRGPAASAPGAAKPAPPDGHPSLLRQSRVRPNEAAPMRAP